MLPYGGIAKGVMDLSKVYLNLEIIFLFPLAALFFTLNSLIALWVVMLFLTIILCYDGYSQPLAALPPGG